MNNRINIAKSFRALLNETFKLTFNDKKEIDNIVRNKYKEYLNSIKDKEQQIEIAKKTITFFKSEVENGNVSQEAVEKVIKDNQLDYLANLEKPKLMLYNQFYKENIDYIKQDYINYKERNTKTNFSFDSKKNKDLKNIDYEKFYNSLYKSQQNSIKNFLEIVSERILSGTGESISRKIVRDAFFNTPEEFQKMFAEEPSPYLWRGDYTHPCDDDYDHTDEDYLSMQSFSTSKHVAKEFGYHFNAKNIKDYGGSFSLKLYLDYGGDPYDISDDEGEVMFFDVKYKCGK